MRSARRRRIPAWPALALCLALVLAACGSSPESPGSATPTDSVPDATGGPTEPATGAPDPTAVPGSERTPAPPPPTHVSTTQTDWGEILDVLPADFPVFPGAEVADPPAEPVSGAFLAPAGVDEVAVWYRDALVAAGWSTLDLSSPLEDGSRVLDISGDIPECRLQVTFRPQDGSTMITVLYAAGCAGGGG
jgi:hypothetical protein